MLFSLTYNKQVSKLSTVDVDCYIVLRTVLLLNKQLKILRISLFDADDMHFIFYFL